MGGRRWWVGSLLLVLGVAPQKVLASLGPVGPPLKLPIQNQTPATPVVVEGRAGDLEVAWLQPGPTALDLVAQHLGADGVPTGQAVTANEGLIDLGGTVATCLTGGGFVIAWVSVVYPPGLYPTTPSASVVAALVLDFNGQPVGAPFQLSAPAAFAQHVRIDALRTGGFVALWSSSGASGASLQLRRFDNLGRQVGDDTATAAAGATPIGVAGLADGGYLATWLEPSSGLTTERFDSAGKAVGSPAWQIGSVGGPALVAANAAGQVVFAWMTEDPSLQPRTPIEAQVFDLSGTALSPRLTVAAPDATGNPVLRGLAMGGDGRFTLVWDRTPFPGLSSVVAQLYDPSGEALGGQSQIDAGASGHDNHGHAVLASDNGTWLVHWTGTLESQGDFVERERSSFCSSSLSSVCLREDRFKIDVTFEDPRTGLVGVAHPVPVASDTGGLWFFDSSNPELVVKVLDGSVVNKHFWLFYASLTNVGFDLTATDTATGAQRVYHNPVGQMASVGDVTAFAANAQLDLARSLEPQTPQRDAFAAGCHATDFQLCVSRSRFTVDVAWHDPRSGNAGNGHALQRSNESGDFWFFSPANIEMSVKILDGTPVNGHFWVFFASLTDVELDLNITDEGDSSKPTRTYHNPAYHMASGVDVDAF